MKVNVEHRTLHTELSPEELEVLRTAVLHFVDGEGVHSPEMLSLVDILRLGTVCEWCGRLTAYVNEDGHLTMDSKPHKHEIFVAPIQRPWFVETYGETVVGLLETLKQGEQFELKNFIVIGRK